MAGYNLTKDISSVRTGAGGVSTNYKLFQTKKGGYSGGESKHSVGNLQFPIDVESDPGLGNHGHYMMFYINQQDHAKLKFGDPSVSNAGSGAESMSIAAANYNLENTQRLAKTSTGLGTETVIYETKNQFNSWGNQLLNQSEQTNSQKAAGHHSLYDAAGKYNKARIKLAEGESAHKKSLQAIHVERASTTRLKTAIALYMPASVQVSYGANYTDTEIGSMAERAAQVLESFGGGDASGGFTKLLNADSDLVKNAGQFLLAGVGNLPGFGGAKELEAMKKGRIISNRMELAFKGINKRQFQYTFKMVPRSQQESDMIRNIVYAFKFNMLPEFEGGDLKGRSFIVPNTFDIQYMYNGKGNTYLHNISTCVLESMNVNYGGDRYKTYTATDEGAPPSETTISLNFKEMEMITRSAVAERGM